MIRRSRQMSTLVNHMVASAGLLAIACPLCGVLGTHPSIGRGAGDELRAARPGEVGIRPDIVTLNVFT